MQWHSLQHRFAGSGDPGWSLFSADLVETSGLRACRVCSNDCEERHSDRYANDAGNLCGSGISLWQSSPRRRSGIFYDWIAANGSGFLDITDQRVCREPASPENICTRGRKLVDRPSPKPAGTTSSQPFLPLRCHSRNNNCYRYPRNRRGSVPHLTNFCREILLILVGQSQNRCFQLLRRIARRRINPPTYWHHERAKLGVSPG